MRQSDKSDWARNYLLGRSSPEDRAAAEENYFVDENAFQELVSAEDDLVDDFVRGRLAWRDSRAFRRQFLTTASRQQKAAIARALWRNVDPITKRHRNGLWMRPLRAIAISALLMLSAAVVWQFAPTRMRQAPQSSTPHTAEPRARPVVSLVLTGNTLRASGETQEFSAPQQAGEIDLHIPIALAGYSSFDAELKTHEGHAIWNGMGLNPDANQTLTMRIPADLLDSGDYILHLQAGSPGARVEAGEYSFRLRRK